MTDEPPGDAEFKRWFAEQDPFRSIEVDHRLEEFQRLRELRLQEQKKTPPPVFGLFGMALIPYVLLGLGLVVAAFFSRVGDPDDALTIGGYSVRRAPRQARQAPAPMPPGSRPRAE